MAAPVLAAIAKASILAAADESHRKRMATIFGLILSPVLVVMKRRETAIPNAMKVKKKPVDDWIPICLAYIAT